MNPIEIIKIPQDNVNDEMVLITNIYVSHNQKIEAGELVIDYETSKANFEIHSKHSGYIKLKCEEGESINVGSPVIEIYLQQVPNKKQKNSLAEKTKNKSFSKKALEKIKKHRLNAEIFKNNSFVTEQLVDEYIANNKVDDKNEDIKKVKTLSPGKLSEISNLSNNSRLGLISYVSKSFDINNNDNINNYYSYKEFENTISTVIIEIVSKLLDNSKYEHLNSYFDNNKILIYKKINFGLALNLGNGLKIGVIHDSNKKSIGEIENRIITLVDSYIDGKMNIRDVSGATVVLTDLTEKNIDSFRPIILNNNSIMIGLSGYKAKKQTIIVAFDHRVSDGLEIADFLNDVINNIKSK